MHNKDYAICIRKTDYSDSSQILTLFCRQSGKISAIAKGSRRSKSAFGSPIEIFSIGEIVYISPKSGSLATLAEFDHSAIFSSIRTSLFAMNAGLLSCELVNLLLEEYDPHPKLYDILKNLLFEISQNTTNQKRLANLIIFQLGLLEEIGTAIPLHSCGNCSAVLNKNSEVFFCGETGGFICRDCEAHFHDKFKISSQIIQSLSKPDVLQELPENTLTTIHKLLIYHFAYICRKMPKAAAFFLKPYNRNI